MELPDFEPAKKAGLFDKFFIRIAGVDEETLRQCPEADWDCVRRVAEVMLCVWLYQAALFSIVMHRLFAAPGQVRPDLIFVCCFLATFILLIDSFMVMRSGWNLSGIEELKRGGIDVSGGMAARIKAGIFLSFRILLSAGIAQLAAIFLGILIFWSDIAPSIQKDYVQSNANLIAAETAQVDQQIKEDTAALGAETARQAALASQVTALRQDRIDPSANRPEMQQANQEVTQLLSEKAKADEAVQHAETFASDELGGIRGSQENSGVPGDGPRRRAAMEALDNARSDAAKVSAALDAARARIDVLHQQSAASDQTSAQRSETELPRFDAALATEEGKVRTLRDDLDRRTEHREEAIRAAVEAAPNYIPPANGVLSQIKALEHLAKDDPKIAVTIILVDVVSFGFELAAVLAKVTSYVPTLYTALLARNAYMRVVRLVDGMMAELNRGPGAEEAKRDPSSQAGRHANPRQDDPADDSGSNHGSDPFENLGDPSSPGTKRPRGRPPKSPFNGKPGRPLPFDGGFSVNEP